MRQRVYMRFCGGSFLASDQLRGTFLSPLFLCTCCMMIFHILVVACEVTTFDHNLCPDIYNFLALLIVLWITFADARARFWISEGFAKPLANTVNFMM